MYGDNEGGGLAKSWRDLQDCHFLLEGAADDLDQDRFYTTKSRAMEAALVKIGAWTLGSVSGKGPNFGNIFPYCAVNLTAIIRN
jgi:hypothetical protein